MGTFIKQIHIQVGFLINFSKGTMESCFVSGHQLLLIGKGEKQTELKETELQSKQQLKKQKKIPALGKHI